MSRVLVNWTIKSITRPLSLVKRLSSPLIAKALFFVLMAQLLVPNAIATNTEEYQVKAAFIFNFIAFTQWPKSNDESIDLCIYGQDNFGDVIDGLQTKTVGSQAIKIVRLGHSSQFEACQVLFISKSEINNLAKILDNVQDKSILTIADSPGAAHDGVIINMQLIQNKIKFEVNLKSADNARLSISSRLLQLATEVHR